MAARLIRRLLVAPLIFLNFALYLSAAALAGWSIDQAIDNGWEAVSYNPATFYMVMFSLVASVVGLASTLSGMHHVFSWESHTLVGAAASATIAWLLTLLAMGFAFKEISIGEPNSPAWQVIALEVTIIILAITQFFYVLGVGIGGYRGGHLWRKREATSADPTPVPGPAPAPAPAVKE